MVQVVIEPPLMWGFTLYCSFCMSVRDVWKTEIWFGFGF